jgi:hypothetical protein
MKQKKIYIFLEMVFHKAAVDDLLARNKARKKSK